MRPPTLSPLEKAQLILAFPNEKHPFPIPDWKAPARRRLRRRPRSSSSSSSSILPPLTPLLHSPVTQESTREKKNRRRRRRCQKKKQAADNSENHGWAADTMRIINEINQNDNVGVLQTIQATSIIQQSWRRRQQRVRWTEMFLYLCQVRREYEYKNVVLLQCMMRQCMSKIKIKKLRHILHTRMIKRVQRIGRAFLRNQETKMKLRSILLSLIRPLVPSAHLVSQLFQMTKRRPSHSHRGAIKEEELLMLRELAMVGIRLIVHQTLFAELLDALRWVQHVNKVVQLRHQTYQHRRTFSLSFCKSQIITSVVKQRSLKIQRLKLQHAKLGVIEKGALKDERNRERDEREQMWREEHVIKLQERRAREKIEKKVREQEIKNRKERERIWRQALIIKKREDFLNKRKAWMEEMCQRCMEQGLYLATLSVRGERRVKRSVDDPR